MSIPADIKRDFPVLQQQVHDKPLIYLDSGNTSQKPQAVIDAMNDYYETTNANVHRGSYDLAVRATEALYGDEEHEHQQMVIRQAIPATTLRVLLQTLSTPTEAP